MSDAADDEITAYEDREIGPVTVLFGRDGGKSWVHGGYIWANGNHVKTRPSPAGVECCLHLGPGGRAYWPLRPRWFGAKAGGPAARRKL